MIRLYLVDDHAVVAESMAARFAEAPDIEQVGIAHRLDQAVAAVPRLSPDVVVCDVLFGEVPEGLGLAGRLGAAMPAPPPVLLLSSYGARYFQRTALSRGAAGYVLKSATTDEVLRAVRAVATGGTAFSASILQPDPSVPMPPSERELQIIAEVSLGGGNGDIGGRLGIAGKTVESHLSRMFARYGVATRTELAVLALRERWLPADGGDPTRSGMSRDGR